MLEEGVQNMSLDQQPRLKLTLRMKRPTANPPGDPLDPPTSLINSKDDDFKEDLPNYEVYRMEGVENSRSNPGKNNLKSKSPWRIRKRNRKRDISTCSSNSSGGSNSGGLKRLKLRLGDETMSTIDLDSIMT